MVTLAFLVVASTCAVLIPVMLYIFWLKPSGWQWYDAALFGSIIASTDAVAIVAVLKKSARPISPHQPAACWCLTDAASNSVQERRSAEDAEERCRAQAASQVSGGIIPGVPGGIISGGDVLLSK